MTPFDQSTRSSRTVFSMGHAARGAAGQIREQLVTIGAKALETAPDDLELDDEDEAGTHGGLHLLPSCPKAMPKLEQSHVKQKRPAPQRARAAL